jgi:hypothetical protein
VLYICVVEWANTKIVVISGQRAPRAKSNFGFPTEREVVVVLELFGERLSYLPRAAAAAAALVIYLLPVD